MSYNLNIMINEINGNPIVVDGKNQTVKDFCILSLLSVPSSANADIKEKINRAVLANKIMNSNGEVDLTAEQVTTLKAVSGEGLAPWALYQVLKVIDPTSVKD